jgi:hypothetical protein
MRVVLHGPQISSLKLKAGRQVSQGNLHWNTPMIMPGRGCGLGHWRFVAARRQSAFRSLIDGGAEGASRIDSSGNRRHRGYLSCVSIRSLTSKADLNMIWMTRTQHRARLKAPCMSPSIDSYGKTTYSTIQLTKSPCSKVSTPNSFRADAVTLPYSPSHAISIEY